MLILSQCMLIVSIFAQPQQTNYRLFDMQHGLAQMKVHSIHEDKLGNLWIGTRNGLSKFNGETFRNYYTSDGLMGNRILLITENDEGDLIFITENGISIFDGVDFTNIPLNMSDDQTAVLVNRSRDNVIFHNIHRVCTFDFSNFNINCEYFKLDEFAVQDNSEKGYRIILSNKLFHKDTAFISRDLYYFFNSRDEPLSIITDQKTRKLQLKYNIIPYDSLYHEITDYEDWNLTIASGAAASGIYTSNESIVGISKKGRPWSLQSSTRIVLVHENDFEHIILGSESGIYIIPPPFFFHFSETELPYIWSVIETADGEYYCSSYTSGLHRISSDFQIEDHNLPKISKAYLLHSTKDRENDIYIPNFQGVVKIESDHSLNDDFIYHKPGYNHTSLHYDSTRNWVVGSLNDRISIIEDDKQRFINLMGIGLDTGQYYNSISQDIYDRYWLTSYSGLCVYDPDTEEAIDFGDQYDTLVNEGTFGMYQDDSLLWIGLNSGLARINTSTMQTNKMESVVLNSIVKDIINYNDSLVLIGAKDGLYFFNKKRFLSSDEIDIWQINESHGYTGVEPGFDCFYRDSENRIWITSASHLSILLPNEDLIDRSLLIPNFIKINGSQIHFNHTDSTYEITKGINDVEVEYEACGLIRPKKVMYKYQIDDGDISAWNEDTKLLIDDLPHGNHRVSLWAGPSDLSMKYLPVDQIVISVSLPLYRRAWFQWLMGIIAFGTLLYYTINFYIMRKKQKRYEKNLRENQYLKNQVLLSELNPHFIFNALSSIQSNILKDNKLKASKQVVRLSKLMRAFLNSSYRSNINRLDNITVPLNEEIQLISHYLTFEKEKHNNIFDFEINIQDDIEIDNLNIPPMIIQPLVENSVKHGIIPLKNRRGKIEVDVKETEETIKIVVNDNGIGIEEAERRNKKRIGKNASLGTKIVAERIDVLKKLGYDIFLKKSTSDQGTRIQIDISNG